jgi:hypothetical protein
MEDRAWADYSEHFRNDALPKLLSSAVFLSIQAEGPEIDVQQATQLGAAMLLGKPLLFVVPPGRTMPDCLRRAADYVIDDWRAEDPRCQQELTAAIQAITGDE